MTRRRRVARGLGTAERDTEAAFRPDGTVLTDLSANIFAALLLVLLMLMQFEAQPPAPQAPAPGQTLADARPRVPLGARALVDLLFARGAPDDLSVDLGETGLVLAPGAAAPLPLPDALPVLEQRLASGQARPLHLFVFSNARYADVAALLDRQRQTWTELSVPLALRDPASPDRWSPAFLALSRTRDAAMFRAGLGQLLAGAPATRPDGHVVAGGLRTDAGAPIGPASGTPASLLDRLLRGLEVAGILAALAFGFGTVALVERLVPARRLG